MVISVDYTIAPRSNWKIVTDQPLSVWKALLTKGAMPARIGVFGHFASGGLAAGRFSRCAIRDCPCQARFT